MTDWIDIPTKIVIPVVGIYFAYKSLYKDYTDVIAKLEGYRNQMHISIAYIESLKELPQQYISTNLHDNILAYFEIIQENTNKSVNMFTDLFSSFVKLAYSSVLKSTRIEIGTDFNQFKHMHDSIMYQYHDMKISIFSIMRETHQQNIDNDQVYLMIKNSINQFQIDLAEFDKNLQKLKKNIEQKTSFYYLIISVLNRLLTPINYIKDKICSFMKNFPSNP